MTITNQYVAPIEAGALPGGLLSTARRLPAGSDWRGGITFTPACGTAGIWGCTTDGNFPQKEISQKDNPSRFDPFMVYSGQSCSGAPILDELGLAAEAALVRARSGLMARELVVSHPLIGNPDLSVWSPDITPVTGPTDFKSSIAGLLSGLVDCGGGEAMLHVPTIAMPFLDAVGIKWNGTGWFLGPIPVSVDDYPNRDGLAPTDPDYAYAYLTRPVEYELSELIDVRNYQQRINEAVVLAEQLVILRFDTCCAYSINVDFGA